ncbi:hypothetical protein B879_03391 [Cecembia lonarensis LW9]|uniref:Uncharacterized protein n=1 Tax=Cecembia lonarensis (strain CCUG 58316 / KCTC 22772 / LW9) TaxID=1225176 RepID=K1KUY7_CECL9|nr:hypothetical protein B879_03391 [Cecembia lonarensis LW9]
MVTGYHLIKNLKIDGNIMLSKFRFISSDLWYNNFVRLYRNNYSTHGDK